MALCNLVKVSNIKDLSNARYCAGMGVELLGFDVDELSVETFTEIKNWITGVKIVAETKQVSLEAITEIAQKFAPDYIQVPSAAGLEPFFINNTIHCISADANDAPQPWVTFVLSETNTVAKAMVPFHVYEELPSAQQLRVAIELVADHEERPGFSNFDTIMDALEILEIED
jgi:phosphoribosylanthranilate isomerase